MDELKNHLRQLRKRLLLLQEKLSLEEKRKKLRELEAQTLKESFWDDRITAQKISGEIADLQNELSEIEKLEERLNSAFEIANLATSGQENSGSESPEVIDLREELREEVVKIEKDLQKFELNLFLSGKYDSCNCLVSIHAGQGGVEAMDWAAMLKRMYLRFSENKGWKAKIIDETVGEEAGIKSTTLEFEGKYAYGLLKGEAGTHRLVRQSPFNADNLRQTSFASVEVLPVIAEETHIQIDPKDLQIQTFRASGPGGQNVNKIESAVRIIHKPTNLIASSQIHRTQYQNKEEALKILKAKIWQLEEIKREGMLRKLKGEYKTASFGNQIRSYTLHPYKLIKDLRTNFEVRDADKVLDGDLDPLIESQLKIK